MRRPYLVGDIIRDYTDGADWRVVEDGIDHCGQVACEPANDAARRRQDRPGVVLCLSLKPYRRRLPRREGT